MCIRMNCECSEYLEDLHSIPFSIDCYSLKTLDLDHVFEIIIKKNDQIVVYAYRADLLYYIYQTSILNKNSGVIQLIELPLPFLSGLHLIVPRLLAC